MSVEICTFLIMAVICVCFFVIFIVCSCRRDKHIVYGDALPIADENFLQKLWSGQGILNTSLTLQQACPGYFDSHDRCPSSALDCKGGVVNIADYNILNNVLATTETGVSCFSLATSLQSSRLAQIVFGPFPTGVSPIDNTAITGDTTVGIFLDIRPLRKYIACLSILDSGSEGRYGNTSDRIPQALKITSSRLSNDYQGVLDECASSNECGLFMAGCAGSQGANPSISQQGKGYNFVKQPFKIPTYTGKEGGPWLPKGWFFLDADHGTPGTVPFFSGTDEGLMAFENTLIQAQRIVGQQADAHERENNTHCQNTLMFNTFKPPKLPIDNPEVTYQNSCADYWSYQFKFNSKDDNYWNTGDGFRESEVDIFVPQTKDANPFWGSSMHCHPDKSFVDAFRQAVVGVYATKYCAKDVQGTKNNASPCCTQQRSEMIAIAMADKYNASPDVPRKIEAWSWDVVDPTGKWSPPDDPTKARLNVSKIT